MIRFKFTVKTFQQLFAYNWAFCSQKNQTQAFMKLKALAAAEIIRFVNKQPLLPGAIHPIEFQRDEKQVKKNTDEKQTSNLSQSYALSQLIINHLKKKGFSQDVVNVFVSMFHLKEGIELPQFLFKQKTIKDAMNRKNKNFTFFPNKLVTIQVFQTILRLNDKTLMHGPPGISKTTALVFYCYLSYMINEYELTFDEVVATDIPRLFYLSYYKMRKSSNKQMFEALLDQEITQLLINHCPQKIISQINKDDQSEKKLKTLKDIFSQKHISCKFALDQFNSLISQCRKFNALRQDQTVSPELIKHQKERLKIEESLWVNRAQILSDQAVLYNSSKNIELEFITKKGDKDDYSFDLTDNSNLTQVDISYFQALNSTQGKKELIRIFFFELERLCKPEQMKIIQQSKQEYKINQDQWIESLPNMSIAHYYVKQYLRRICGNGDLQKIAQISKIQKTKLIGLLIYEAVNQYYLSLNGLAQKFCNQGVPQLRRKKLTLLFVIRSILIKEKREANLNDIPTFSLSTLKQNGINFKVTREEINKVLFDIKELSINDQKIRSILNTRDFLKVTQFADQLLLQEMKKEQAFQSYLKQFQSIPSSLGQLLEINYLNFIKKFKGSKIGVEDLNIPLQNQSKFLHFNAQKKMPIQQRFERMIRIDKSFVVGFPQQIKKTAEYIKEFEKLSKIQPVDRKKFNQQFLNTSRNSEVMDLVILEKRKQNSFKVVSIDFTISQTPSKIDDKIESSEKFLRELFKKQNESIKIKEWHHFIVGVKIRAYQKNFKAKVGKSKQQAKCSVKTSQLKNIEILDRLELSNRQQWLPAALMKKNILDIQAKVYSK